MTGITRVVLVSGHRGRSTLAHLVGDFAQAHEPWLVDHMGHEVEERTHALYKIVDRRTMRPAAGGAFDGRKDEVQACFDGRSARAAYHRVREFLYREFGPEVLGRWTVQRLDAHLGTEQGKKARGLVVADVETQWDALPIVSRFGRERCLHLVVGRCGPVLEVPGVETVRVDNPDTRTGFLRRLRREVPSLFIQIVTEIPKE